MIVKEKNTIIRYTKTVQQALKLKKSLERDNPNVIFYVDNTYPMDYHDSLSEFLPIFLLPEDPDKNYVVYSELN